MAWRDQQGRWHIDYEAAPINVKYWPTARISNDKRIQKEVQDDLEAMSLVNSRLQEEPSEFEKRTSMLADDPYPTSSLEDSILLRNAVGPGRYPFSNLYPYAPRAYTPNGGIPSIPFRISPSHLTTTASTGLDWTLNNLLSIFK